jgi:hypothetical protein
MLSVLEDKTKGNLTADEEKLLATALYELRMHYVNLSQQAMEQAASGASTEPTGGQPGGAPADGAGAGGAGPIVTPG